MSLTRNTMEMEGFGQLQGEGWEIISISDNQILRMQTSVGLLMEKVRRMVCCSYTGLDLLRNESYLNSLWNMLLYSKVKSMVWSLTVKAAGVTQQPLGVMMLTAEKASRALCKTEN